MKIDVFLTAEEAKRKAIHDSNIVVIDVLRATSVMITAIAHGVSKIYPYESIEEVREASPASSFSILCGERKGDRKSTRLNSSHANISYAVFCLKKKTTTLL